MHDTKDEKRRSFGYDDRSDNVWRIFLVAKGVWLSGRGGGGDSTVVHITAAAAKRVALPV
jgi:hypothetical protein